MNALFDRGLLFASALLLAANFSPLYGEESPPNTLTAAEKEAGWKLLFDGQSLDAWRCYNKQDAKGWTASEGSLVLAQPGAGDLMTRDPFADFEFAADFKFLKGNNSGIIYRVKETQGPSYSTGPEMQVMHHKPGDKLGKNSGGSLYDMFAPTENPFRGADEWTSFRLVCRGKKIEHWVNGSKVVAVEIGSDEWNKAYAESKWKNNENFAGEASGHICLQDHGASIAFRNLKIRVLTQP